MAVEVDPREWGRLGQGLAVIWVLFQMPRLAAMDTAAELFGGLLGTAFGVLVFGGAIRSAVLYMTNSIRSRSDDQ